MLTPGLDLEFLRTTSHWLGPSHVAPTGQEGGWEIGVLEEKGQVSQICPPWDPTAVPTCSEVFTDISGRTDQL